MKGKLPKQLFRMSVSLDQETVDRYRAYQLLHPGIDFNFSSLLREAVNKLLDSLEGT
jgi:hypothetical protein